VAAPKTVPRVQPTKASDALSPAPEPTPTPHARTVVVPDGTPLSVKLLKKLSSRDANKGQQVDFVATSDLVVDGALVVKEGAPAWGYVTKAVAQLLTRAGTLEFSIERVKGANGQEIPRPDPGQRSRDRRRCRVSRDGRG
jgi:hypothetical protein